jgi:hypothetical protein
MYVIILNVTTILYVTRKYTLSKTMYVTILNVTTILDVMTIVNANKN